MVNSGLQAAGVSCLPAGNKQVEWGRQAGSSYTILQFRAVNGSCNYCFSAEQGGVFFLLEKIA